MSYNDNRSDRPRRSDDRGYDRPPMHDATCAKCGKACKVPFKPTGNRPIYCSDCFRAEGGSSSARRSDDRGARTSSDRQLYDAICDSCGSRCQIPFQPRPGRKVFCSHCFEKMEKGEQSAEPQQNNRTQDQLDAINIKLGKILQLLSSNSETEEITESKPKEIEKPTEKLALAEVVKSEKVEKKEPKTKKKASTKKKLTV